jgi:hypothetical protein
MVVVPPHRLDRRNGGQRRDGFRAVHVAGVDDEVDASQHHEEPVRQAIEELGAVGVRDYADTRRQGFSLISLI